MSTFYRKKFLMSIILSESFYYKYKILDNNIFIFFRYLGNCVMVGAESKVIEIHSLLCYHSLKSNNNL